MGLFEEARFLVDPAAFDKYCFNGLKGRQLGRVSYFVEMVYHRAIKVSEEPIGTEPIFWNWFVGLFGVSNEVFMGCLDGSHTGGRNQIKAKPQIDHGAHNRGCRDFAARPPRFGELDPPQGIGFPKVDARSEPIPIIGAGNEILSVQEIISDRLVARPAR